jgi:hypothetical protein
MAVAESSTRKCRTCGETKPLSDFHRHKQGHWNSYCRPCTVERTRQWRKANAARYKATNHAYYMANREEALAQSVTWHKANPEKRKAIWTRYRANNLERVRENEAAYRARNRDECNARINAWKAKNKHLLAFYARGRDAALRRATPKWADKDEMRRIYARASRLRRETGEAWHVDHIVPLISELVCGLHWEGNLQVLPASENLSKNNTKWPDMPYEPKRRLAYLET